MSEKGKLTSGKNMAKEKKDTKADEPVNVLEKISKAIDTQQKSLKEIRSNFEAMKKQFISFMQKTEEQTVNCCRAISNHEDFLKRMTATNENAEETLLNVLAAIRQTECLQAWYPAQKGYPEMKVTGTHPLKLEGKNG